jgi:hypothetical protein
MPSKVNSPWPVEFTMARWEFILKLIRIHVLEDEFAGGVMNSLEAMPNSCHQRRIPPWPVEFAMAGWEFILRLIRIHVLEDEFVSVTMNSLVAMLNSLESTTNSWHKGWIPSQSVEFTMTSWEFILRLIRIHVLEDEFVGVAMNSFAAMLNSLESMANSCHQR